MCFHRLADARARVRPGIQPGEMPHAERQNQRNAKRLHATIAAARGYYGDMRLLSLSFRLTNESDRTSNSRTESWKLIIDGREAPDPGGQLWMGGKPYGGYDLVNPGQTFVFGKALPYKTYFPKPRDYTVLWIICCLHEQ